MKRLLLSCFAGLAWLNVHAQPGGYAMFTGANRDLSHTTISYTSRDPYFIHPRIHLTTESGISVYDSNVGQGYITPKLTWNVISNLYVTGGVGVSLLSNKQIGSTTLSTKFQFIDHVGVEYSIKTSTRVGIRYTHISNAGIKKPNPGVDSVQWYITHRF